MLQRVPIAFAQVKPSNTAENLLNKIRQLIYNSYQHSRVLHTFVPNKYFINTKYFKLLDISLENFIFSKFFDSEFSFVEMWLTDKNF